MDPTSPRLLDPRALYEAAMANRAKDQQRLEGAQAVRLIEGASPPPTTQAPRALPVNATISVRV